MVQLVSEQGLSIYCIDPSSQIIWPNNYGIWVDEFTAMDLLDYLDTTWPAAIVHVDNATKKLLHSSYSYVNQKQLKIKMM